MHTLLQDVRFGMRLLARSPGHTLLTVLVLALGVTATTTILSWMNATMLDPVPGATRTAGLVSVLRGEYTTSPMPPLSYPDFIDLRDGQSAVGDLIAYHDDTVFFTGDRVPGRGYAAVVSSNYFDVLGVPLVRGRGFLRGEDLVPDAASVAVISHDLWQTRFNLAPQVLGRPIEVNRHVYTIVGVAPRGFIGCKTGVRVDLWIPLSMDRAVFGGDRFDRRDIAWLNVLGRLGPGVAPAAGRAALNAAMQRIAAAYPAAHLGDNAISIDPLWRSPFGANGYLAASLPILLAIGAVVLVLASANVANLLLVRTIARRRELAIRSSIGATQNRLVRQLVVESLLLGLAGGTLAALLTSWTAETMAGFIPPSNVPIALNGRFDVRILVATLGIAVATCIACGVFPALRASAACPVDALKDESGSVAGGPHRNRVLGGLVIAQVALSALLLVCAGLLVRSLRNAEHVDPGFDARGVILASVELQATGYTRDQAHAVETELLRALAALPGVDAVSIADWVPLTFSRHTDTIAVEGFVPRSHETMDVRSAFVGPAYLDTMRIRRLAGREFTDHDVDGQPRVCMVDRAFVDRFWRGADALGKRLQSRGNWYTVVGITEQTRHQRLNESDEPIVYFPLLQAYRGTVTLHVRAAGNSPRLMPAIEKTIHTADPRLPVFHVTTLAERARLGTLFERLAGTFVGVLGLVALALSGVGIYGVLAYSSRQRIREMGVRLALGARPSQVFRLVLGRGLAMTAAGLAIGLTAAAATTGTLRALLVGVDATDSLTFVVVACVLLLVATAACVVPAWRAAQVTPLRALRHQ